MEKKTLTYDEALHKSAAYCSLSEHCTSELMDKFKYWDVLPEYREKIILFLVRENYIDEKRFASAFVKDKFSYNKWGKIRLRLELKAKKIEESIIEEALAEIREKEYRLMITKLIREKEKNLEYRNEYEKKGKLFRYLSGKGFENEFISKAIGNYE
jgi:regulatory protein